jgi:hypothetical protein
VIDRVSEDGASRESIVLVRLSGFFSSLATTLEIATRSTE